MDEYCSKCGRVLKKGEVCDCSADEVQYIKPNQEKKEKNDRFIGIWESFFNILVCPIEAGRKFVLKTDMLANVLFMLLQAIISGVFAVLISSKKNEKLAQKYKSDMFDNFDFDIGGYSSKLKSTGKLQLDKNFFMTVGFSLLITFALAFILYIVLKIVKLNLKFENILSIIVIKTVPISVLDCVACVTLTFSSAVGWVLFLLSGIIGIIYVVSVYNSVVAIADNKKMLIFVVTFSIFFILLWIFVRNVALYYVPVSLQEDLEYILETIFFLK